MVALLNKKISISKNTLYLIFVGIILILIAGFRPIGIDNDSVVYASLFNASRDSLSEPTLWWIIDINKYIFGGNVVIFFLTYALISVSIKIYLINKYSFLPLLSVFVYISMFFILQDMTQIRAGVAIAIVYLSYNDIVDKNIKLFILKILIAILFHYSAVVMLFLYFLSTKKENFLFYLSLPIIGLFFHYNNILINIIYIIVEYLPSFLSGKLSIYLALGEQGEIKIVNPINLGNILLLFVYYFNLICYFMRKTDILDSNHKLHLLFIKTLGWGFFILFSFSFIEVLSYRLANFMFFSLVFLIPYQIIYFKQILFMYFFIVLYLTYTLLENIEEMLVF